MKKYIFLILMLLIPVMVSAAPCNFESITVAGTATTFTMDVTNMHWGYCSATTAQMRYVIHRGGTPTATYGQIVEAGQAIELKNGLAIANFKIIRTGATSGVIDCTLCE